MTRKKPSLHVVDPDAAWNAAADHEVRAIFAQLEAGRAIGTHVLTTKPCKKPAPVTRADGTPAHVNARPRLRQSEIDAERAWRLEAVRSAHKGDL